jgi:hypothetical protein
VNGLADAGPGLSPTLLDSYTFNGSQPDMAAVSYHPWQYATTYNGSSFVVTDQTHWDYQVPNGGAYSGWDALLLPNDGYFRSVTDPAWLQINLTRPATVAIVWRSAATERPAWLSGWTLGPSGADSSGWGCGGSPCPVYTRVFTAAQTVTLGGVRAAEDPLDRDVYYVLLAEANGQPSTPPTQLATPPAYANQTCPSWVHDQYAATAADGQIYPTWHPQIDPVYWCYFRHDHGSDPIQFLPTYLPLYGYTAAAMGDNEPHVGFKTYVFDDGSNHRWLITQHFGTSSLDRACVRYHTLDVAVAMASTGQLLADLHLMADFGTSASNVTGQALAPAACPAQALRPTDDGSTGVRELPVAAQGPIMYEPWRFDGRGNILGLDGTVTFNTRDSVVICDGAPPCSSAVETGGSGSYRFFMFTSDFGVHAGAHTGQFYTDPRGLTLMDPAGPEVRKSLAPQPNARGGVRQVPQRRPSPSNPRGTRVQPSPEQAPPYAFTGHPVPARQRRPQGAPQLGMMPVIQYVDPGLSVAPQYFGERAACFTSDYWSALYSCQLPPFSAFPIALEGALQRPN